MLTTPPRLPRVPIPYGAAAVSPAWTRTLSIGTASSSASAWATVQGLGGALSEEVVYAADGQNLSATFMDYALPVASGLPSFETEHLERPDPGTPLGMKGMAEGGVMGASAAVSNAVADALAPLGLEAGRQPFTARRLAEALGTAKPQRAR